VKTALRHKNIKRKIIENEKKIIFIFVPLFWPVIHLINDDVNIF
jgi:hypothetical protein